MNITKLAAIDIGSNAVRLLINTIYESELQTTFNKTSLVRVPVRLGRDAFSEGKISDYNLNRMVKAMKAYKHLMDIHEVEDYVAYATSAMRELDKAEEVVEIIKKEAEIDIQIIDGKKEAQVIFSTELKNFVDDNNNYLYVDVGGGSTEITLLADGQVKSSKSFKIGTVRWLNGKVDEHYLEEKIKPWVQENCQGVDDLALIGSGGNINYMFKYSETKKGKPLNITYLSRQLKILESLSFDDRLTVYNMKPDRADVIVPALKIYTQIMKYAGCKHIFVPKIGLADGTIQYMYSKLKKQ